MPLIELVKSEMFKKPILEALEMETTQTSTDFVNLQNDKLAIVLSPVIEPVDNNSPSFYVSLTIHDIILHNCLLDIRANHNFMPKAVIEELGLDITSHQTISWFVLFWFKKGEMPRINQRTGHYPNSAAHEEYDDGYCGSRCPS